MPKYVDINSIEQLNANAKKFGGKIVGIEPGSGLMVHAQRVIKKYDLNNMKLVGGSTAGMVAALKSAIARKAWIAVTLWTPSWMVQKFPMKFLKDPKHVCAPPQAYYWIGHKGFSKNNPLARELIASVYVPHDADVAINGAVKNGKSMNQAIKDWLDSHKDRVKRWENVKKQ